MRHKLEITGNDAKELIGMLRAMGVDLDVEVLEDSGPSIDPMDDLVFYAERISSHLLRLSSASTTLRAIDNKLAGIRSAMESIAESQRKLALIEESRRTDELYDVRK